MRFSCEIRQPVFWPFYVERVNNPLVAFVLLLDEVGPELTKTFMLCGPFWYRVGEIVVEKAEIFTCYVTIHPVDEWMFWEWTVEFVLLKIYYIQVL